MADIEAVLNALSAEATASGLKFDAGRAVLTIEFTDKLDRVCGQTVSLSHLLTAADATSAAKEQIAGAVAHFAELSKFDAPASVAENKALRAELEAARAEIAEKDRRIKGDEAIRQTLLSARTASMLADQRPGVLPSAPSAR